MPSFRLRLIAPVAATFALGIAAHAEEFSGFGAREREAIEETLHTINLTPADLGYRKGPLEVDPCRLPLVERLMGDPVSIPAEADRLLAAARRKSRPSESLALLAAELPGGQKLDLGGLAPLDVALTAEQQKEIPAWLQPVLVRLAGAYRASRAERDKAFAPLKPEDRALLEDNILGLLQEEDLGFKFSAELAKDPAPLWKILESVEYAHLWRSGLFMMR
jgi:hypothetical protein